MNMKLVAFGVLLIAVSLIVASVQDLHIYNIYGDVSNKWYFYSVVGAILIIGIMLAAWALMKKEGSSNRSYSSGSN